MEIAVVEVPRSKLESLEKDRVFLQQIREMSKQVEEAMAEYVYAKDKSLEKKKAHDTLAAELHQLIESGPPKPDPQGRLPFASEEPVDSDEGEEEEDAPLPEDEEETIGSAEPSPPVASKPAAKLEVPIPTEINGLDLTDRQKQLLAATGAKTLADLVDLGNGNWPEYPKGLASVKGLGSAAVAKLATLLPSTAPGHDSQPGELPAETKKIKVMTFAAGNENLQPGDMYDATVRDDGVAVVTLPGQDPVEFQSYEYELVS